MDPPCVTRERDVSGERLEERMRVESSSELTLKRRVKNEAGKGSQARLASQKD